jgi:hypothetical protein
VYNDGKLGVISKGGDLLIDNDAKHSHHGNMAIVKHDGILGKLGIGTKAILVPKHCTELRVPASQQRGSFVKSGRGDGI